MIVYLVVERDRLVDVMSEEKLAVYAEDLTNRLPNIEWDDWLPDDKHLLRKTLSGFIKESKRRIPIVRITKIVVDGTFF